MPTLTPELAGTALIASLVVYALTIGYSIYMAMLNHKQAKVKGLIEKTNKLLEKQTDLLEKILEKK